MTPDSSPFDASTTATAVHVAVEDLADRAPSSGNLAVALGRVRNVTFEYYRPLGADPQQPHADDEIYIVATGTAELIVENQAFELRPGDAVFVAAGAEHRFARFSGDFATWVIFVPA